MKKLIVELVENDVLRKSESQVLHTEKIEEFLEALVLMCNKLEVNVPLWTYKEERTLLKKNLVVIPASDIGNTKLHIFITDSSV